MRNFIRCKHLLAARFRSEWPAEDRWFRFGCVTLAAADPELPGDLAELGGGGSAEQARNAEGEGRSESDANSQKGVTEHRTALADHLGIEPELQEQIWGSKEEKAEGEGRKTEPQKAVDDPIRSDAAADEHHEGHEEHEGVSSDNQAGGKKRPGRLERKIQKMEEELAALRAAKSTDEITDAKQKLLNGEQPLSMEQHLLDDDQPSASARKALAAVKTEADLDRLQHASHALRDWCDLHKDGIDTANGFIGPEKIAKYRQTTQDVLIEAPSKRLALRDSNAAQQSMAVQKQQWDALVKASAPEAFNEKSPLAAKIAEVKQSFPMLDSMPGGSMMATALAIGFLDLEKRPGWKPFWANGANHNGNGNGNGASHDADPDLPASLTPEAVRLRSQIPIAPSTRLRPDSSNDPAATGSRKDFREAMQGLAADPDGGPGSVANALRALRSKEQRGGGDTRRVPVAA